MATIERFDKDHVLIGDVLYRDMGKNGPLDIRKGHNTFRSPKGWLCRIFTADSGTWVGCFKGAQERWYKQFDEYEAEAEYEAQVERDAQAWMRNHSLA